MRNHLNVLARVGVMGAIVVLPQTLPAYEAPVEVGMLTCSIGASTKSTASTIGKALDVECNFRVGRSGPTETYVGTLQFVGDAREVFHDGTALLLVKAPPSMKPEAGVLSQKFSAEGAKQARAQVPLSGDRNSSFVLQSLKEKPDQPTMALGGPPVGIIIAVDLELRASPA